MKKINLGNNLYTLRKRRGLSQEEFAEKIHISRQAVSKWERGEALPDTENLIEIAEFYGITIDELVNSEEPFENAHENDSGRAAGNGDNDESSKTKADSEKKDACGDDSGDRDDGGEDKEKDGSGVKLNVDWRFDWKDIPYAIIVTAAYLLLGFLIPNGWALFWPLFITIPLYDSVVVCIKKRRLSPFEYPVLCAFLYCLFGMLYGIWHPGWLIFVTIPLYYAIAHPIDRLIAGKRGESIYVDEIDDDDDD